MKAKQFINEMKNAGALRLHCRTCQFIGEAFPLFGNIAICVEFKNMTVFLPVKLLMFKD